MELRELYRTVCNVLKKSGKKDVTICFENISIYVSGDRICEVCNLVVKIDTKGDLTVYHDHCRRGELIDKEGGEPISPRS